MKGLIIFFLLMVLLIWIGRAWRAREIRAFRESDAGLIERLDETAPVPVDEQLLAKARAFTAKAALDTSKPEAAQTDTGQREAVKPLPESTVTGLQRRTSYLPNFDRKWLESLDQAVGRSAYLMLDVPVNELVEGSESAAKVPVLLVRKSDFQPVAGLYRDLPSSLRIELVRIFEVLDMPLVQFPLNEPVTASRVKLHLQSVLRKRS